MAVTNPVSTQTWTSYLDISEVSTYLQFNAAPAGAQKTQLQRYIDAACTWAQGSEGANRPLAATRFQERHDGCSDRILLRRSPFLGLVLCREWRSGAPVGLLESTPDSSVDGVQVNYATSTITRVTSGGWPQPFYPGSRNIEVTYLAGFNPVPPDIWFATIELVAYWFRNTQEAPRQPSRNGNDYGGQATGGLWPGVPNRIAMVFAAYRLPSIG